MSLQKAKAEFQTIRMEGGDLDAYIARFERLARIAGYNLQDRLVLDRFGSGLTSGLYVAIVNGPDEPRTKVSTKIPAHPLQLRVEEP